MNQHFITSNTMALQHFAHSHYKTKIWDTNGVFYSTLTCTELLNEACLRTGTSFQGKREAIKTLLSFKQNIPIPICFEQGICAIPSSSSQKWDCIWYFYAHIKDMKRQGKQTLLQFHNNDELLLNESIYKTRQQIFKAAHILNHFKIVGRA